MSLFYPTNEKILLKAIVTEDFVNYKKPSLFLGFPFCDFKCDLEAGKVVCQNHGLAKGADWHFNLDAIVYNYIHNPITKAIVFGGLEPFLSLNDMLKAARAFRKNGVEDPIIVYSGYTPEEIAENKKMHDAFLELIALKNIIIKYGRYIPDWPPIDNDILGVTLASSNQFAILYN